MELEFFDQTRQRTNFDYWREAMRMFKYRLQVYLQNLDLLTIKQKDFKQEGKEFVIQELRAQRLIETFC